MKLDHPDILLVNRRLSAIDFAVAGLQLEGYDVHLASSMREALSAIESKPIGLILCGHELEDLSGESFLSYLKKDPLREMIPFVFFLPLENQIDVNPKRAFQLGAEDLIFFPLEVSALARRIGKILPPSRSGENNSAASPSVDTRATPAGDVSAAVAALDQRPGIERRTEQRKKLTTPVAVEISRDGRTWVPASIINYSHSGAMVENALSRKYGETVQIRSPGDQSGKIVTGTVVHVLLGLENKRIGFGVQFEKRARWPDFFERLTCTDSKPPTGPMAPDRYPIALKVSRDGLLWIDAEIVFCDAGSARLKTSLLGKPGEQMHLKFNQLVGTHPVLGRIQEITLENGALLADTRLAIDPDGEWRQIYTRLVAQAHPHPPQSPSVAAGKEEQWDSTVLIQHDAPRRPASQNNRFYQSLIGRRMDNYEVVSFISAGAMGGVFKGWDSALERDVALKVISWELSSQETFVKMFFKEARFVSKLNHPNISQIYYIGNVDGIIYYAMEFVHGQTLADLIRNKVRFQTHQVVGYLKIVCSALAFVWKNNIIHRDIKPANIMVTREDELKIVDFGVAKYNNKGDRSSENKIVGSPLYLSPEAIRNEKIDNRSDIYSLGATFYHLLAGEPPFFDASFPNVLQKQLHEPVASLKQKVPELPNFLCAVIEKMLAKNRDERFQEYQQIIESLDNGAA